MSNHFEGKSAEEHLIDARKKGAKVMEETHGAELSGAFFALADGAKESAFYMMLILLMEPSLWVLAMFGSGLLLWKIGRAARLGWERLERLHRLIEEERYEITHHRAQEKEELTDLYRQKGLTGKLLEDVIEVLMADDNRLLQVMLEEELGLKLQSFEHPLRQGIGAGIGVLFGGILVWLGYLFTGWIGALVVGGIIMAVMAYLPAKRQKNFLIKAVVWQLGIAFLALGVVYFLHGLRL